MDSRSAKREIGFRVKLIFGLTVLGGLVGGLMYLHFYIFSGIERAALDYFRAATILFSEDLRGLRLRADHELLLSAAAGAAALTAPVLLFFMKSHFFGVLKLFFGGAK